MTAKAIAGVCRSYFARHNAVAIICGRCARLSSVIHVEGEGNHVVDDKVLSGCLDHGASEKCTEALEPIDLKRKHPLCKARKNREPASVAATISLHDPVESISWESGM